MAFPLVSLLFQEVECDRPSLNPFFLLKKIKSFYFVVSFLEHMKCETNLSYSRGTLA